MQRTTHLVNTSDDIEISFRQYREEKRDGVLIICPGFTQSKETQSFQGISEAFADEQDVICIDFRGHGKSTGLFTFTAQEQKDLEAVFQWAAHRYSRIGIIGFSLGAATAINFTSHQDGIKTVVAVSPPSAFEEISIKFWTPEALRSGLRSLEPGAGCRPGNPWLKKERPIENVAKVSPTPLFLVHGTNDMTVSSHHSKRLFDAAHEPKKLLLIEGAGHAEELFWRWKEKFLPPIRAWLRETF